jgi:hypothetical protein
MSDAEFAALELCPEYGDEPDAEKDLKNDNEERKV